MMLKRILLPTLILSLVFCTVLWAKGEPMKAKVVNGPAEVDVMAMEAPGPSREYSMNFENYVITGNVVGHSTIEYATAYYPRSIAVGIDAVVHIAWCTIGDPSNEVLYAKSEDHGVTFSSPVEVHDGYYGYKASIAVDPNDPEKVYIAYVGYQNSGEIRSNRVSASTDGGNTWGSSVPIYGSVQNCNNPYILVDQKGWVHVVFDNYTDTYTRYNYSIDGGQTWLDEPAVVTIGFADDTFAAGAAVDPAGNIHIFTGGGGGTGTWGTKGVIWTWLDMSGITGPPAFPMPQEVPPVMLAEPDLLGLPSPCMVFTSDGTGHMWYDNQSVLGTSRGVFYRQYKDGSWSDPEEIPPSQGVGACAPSCAIDAHDNLYVIYSDYLAGEVGFDIGENWSGDIFSGTNISGEWQYVNVTGDGENVPQLHHECATWVADDSLLHIVYQTFGTSAAWDIIHEIGFPWPPEPNCGVNQVPDTYNLAGPYTIKAATADIDGNVVNCTLHVWKNGEKVQEVEMTMVEEDNYEFELTIDGAEINDVIEYQGVALDNDGYTGPSFVTSFQMLAPTQPKADLLVVVHDGRLPEFWKEVLSTMTTAEGDTFVYETWDVRAHKGIDASVTNFGWSSILMHGWVVSSIPTRDYEGDPYSEFLQAGTEAAPKNLFLTSMDYFYANDEVGSPEEAVFEAGDFAYDFFGIASGMNDPDQDADSVLLGTPDDPISGSFADEPLVLRPWATDPEVVNWIDWTTAIDYDNDIFIAESEGLGSGVKNDGGSFKTVLLPWMVCVLVQDTLEAGAPNVPQPQAATLLSNVLQWFGTDKGKFTPVGVDHAKPAVLDEFNLAQNYPNPFNPVTHIDYRLANSTDVEMTIFNSLGQTVKTLVNQRMAAGKHSITWNGANDAGQMVTSGTYFYKIKAGDFVKVNKMVLLK